MPLPTLNEERLVAPTGAELQGTAEALGITVSHTRDVSREDDGSVVFLHTGRTDMDYAYIGREPVTVCGERVWMDVAGQFWLESQLVRFCDLGDTTEEKPLILPLYQELLDYWIAQGMPLIGTE